MHIRMADGRYKSDCGGFVGIGVWNDNVEFPEAICREKDFVRKEEEWWWEKEKKVTLVCCVWKAFEYGGPVGQLLIVDWAEVE